MATKLEENVERLIAYKLVTSVTGTISDRAKRKYEKIGEEIGEKFKDKQKLPENSYLIAQLRWSDEAINKARKISLALEEFRQEYPDYGKILDEKIEKHREVRRAYLQFGLKEGDLPENIYLEVIKEVVSGVSDEKAKEFYRVIKEISQALKKDKKKDKGLQELLLPE